MLFVLLFLFLRLPSLFEPYWYGDEGIYLALGQGIRHGLTLYSQIHDNKPPALYYLAALGQTVFGFRLLLLLWMVPTIYVFYLLSKKILNPKQAKLSTLIFLILSSIPLVEGHIANAEIFMLLPTILAVYLIYSRSSVKTLVMAGLLLGFAFTIKVPVFAELVFLCLWLLIVNFKKIKLLITDCCLLIASFILPILFWTFYFFQKGAFSEFIFAALLNNFGYLSSWATGSHSGSATQGVLLFRGVVLISAFIFIFFLKAKKLIPSSLSFILFWFSAALFGSLLSSRPYPHYLIQVLPSFSLLLIFFLFQKKRLFILPAFFILIFSLIKYKFYFYPVLSYYSNFYSYILHFKSKDSYHDFFGQNVNTNYKIAEFIKDNSQVSDRIFVWGDEPYIYPLSNRLPINKYLVAYHIIDFDGYTSVVNSLKTYLPKFIVYYPMENRSFPDLDQLLKKYYFIANQFGKAYIFQLR